MTAFNPLADCARYHHKNSVRKRTDLIADSPLLPSTKNIIYKSKKRMRWEFPFINMRILKLLSLSEREVLLALKMSLPRESESFYLLLNFENDDSKLAVKMLFRLRTDSPSFHFSPSFLPSSPSLYRVRWRWGRMYLVDESIEGRVAFPAHL